MKWYERMHKLMTERGWTLAELSRRSGVPYENLAKYAKGKVDMPRGDSMSRIADALGVNDQELLFGVQNSGKSALASDAKLTNYDRLGLAGTTKRVPRLTLSELALHQAGHDLFSVWSGEMSVIVDEDISSDCIAVSVEDNSMLPSFAPGDVLICNPNAEIEPGNFVLAKANGHDKALFRKYRLARTITNGTPKVELVPLNEDYPTDLIDAEHPGHIIGRCIRVIKQI